MCGIFGVSGVPDAAQLVYLGLYALQHRGQESAGIVAIEPDGRAHGHRGMGLVNEVFPPEVLRQLVGDVAIGHTRYSTTGSTTWENAQPVFKTDGAHSLALGHNGNLVNTAEIAALVGPRGSASTDSDIVTTLLANEMVVTGGLEEAAMRVLPTLRGAFCFVFLDERSVYAARDPHGVRPLSIGRLPNGFVVGLSKIPRLVLALSRQLQIQERFTQQIADHLQRELGPNGVAVVVRAQHSCMVMRGVRSSGDMVTSCMLGAFRKEPAARAEFLAFLER